VNCWMYLELCQWGAHVGVVASSVRPFGGPGAEDSAADEDASSPIDGGTTRRNAGQVRDSQTRK
jgi:hypothetical protein